MFSEDGNSKDGSSKDDGARTKTRFENGLASSSGVVVLGHVVDVDPKVPNKVKINLEFHMNFLMT